MDIPLLIVLIFFLIALAVILFYLVIFLPKSQQKSLKLQLDSFINQQKETNKSEENEKETDKFDLLKEKIIEFSEKLKNNEEKLEYYWKNVDSNIKKEIVDQQNLFQGKSKELSDKINKDLEFRLNSNEKFIKNILDNQKNLFQGKSKELSDSINKESKELSDSINKDLKLRLEENEKFIKNILDNQVSQPIEKLNSVLLSNKRGEWGNTQLEELLSSYLPRDDRLFKREVQLKKKRTNKNEGGLRADAVVFSADNRNNIAIDSKFPLDNYLLSINDEWSKEQQKEFEKNFESDVKSHINKVSEYISPEDGINYAIMFIPSEVIFSKINEQRYYSIIKTATDKKVSICSPTLLLVIIDQIKSWNRNWEQSKNVSEIISNINKLWNNFRLFQERWEKVSKTIESNNKSIKEFNTSVENIVKNVKKIRDREGTLLESLPDNLTEDK